MVVKLLLIFKIQYKIYIVYIKWHNLEKLQNFSAFHILERPIKWKVVNIFAKSTLKVCNLYKC